MDTNWQDFWNQRFAEYETVYGTEPNVFFRSFLDTQADPGSLLLPAEGEGRNAVYAAQKGWRVDAFDFSESAQKKALALAARREVTIHYTISDIRDFIAAEQYDGIALLYVHLPPPIRMPFHREILRSIKPGGWLLLEAFTPAQLQYRSGGPKEEAMLYTADMLRADFAELDIRRLTEEIVLLNEGPFHQGEAALVRLLAVRH